VNYVQRDVKGVSILAPEGMSDNAVFIIGSKYARKKGVPVTERETSIEQIYERLALAWTNAGLKHKLLSPEESSKFKAAAKQALENQIFAPNSPQWFNVGLWDKYGINGGAKGGWHRGEPVLNNYEYPQAHACNIFPVEDSLESIMDLLQNETTAFRNGAGSGCNLSKLRGKNELLSGGGLSSGMLSFMQILDANAGKIRSGGETRRSACMRICDLDHPEVEDFIGFKLREQKKVQVLVEGQKHFNPPDCPWPSMNLPSFTYDFDSEAYQTVSGQNANNSVRIPDSFMQMKDDDEFSLLARKDHRIVKSVKKKDLFDQIAYAAWACADPGVHFSDHIAKWHTTPKEGPIAASNPCSEYLYLNNTACNLGSINLLKFWNRHTKTFDTKGYIEAIQLLTRVLDITVDMAGYVSKEMSERSVYYRTLGLGYTNLGALLMHMGLAYDSDEGRSVAAALMSLITSTAYTYSANECKKRASTPQWFQKNRTYVLKVIGMHLEAARNIFKSTDLSPLGPDFAKIVVDSAERAADLSLRHGIRNAQVSLLAPTGTISFALDCDTTGIEPALALLIHKQLSGGGSLTIVNQSVDSGLQALGYSERDRKEYINTLERTGELPPLSNPEHDKVFQTSFGKNPLSWQAHVKMLAAVQPHMSGAASKTINLPESATDNDVKDIIQMCWELEVKAVSIYRDGCKFSQPMNAVKKTEPTLSKLTAAFDSAKFDPIKIPLLQKRPKSVRQSETTVCGIGGSEIALTVGHYDNSTPAEIWAKMGKAGSFAHGMIDAYCKLWSIAIQYGVPLEKLISAFRYIEFPPNGLVQDHPAIKTANSVIDYIAQHMLYRYQTSSDSIPVKMQGSKLCPNCGNLGVSVPLHLTGNCLTCSNCGYNTGCG